LPMSRGNANHRLSYGSYDKVQSLNISWDKALNYVKQKRKPHKPRVVYHKSCEVCTHSFTANRVDARFCSFKCRMKNLHNRY